MISELREIKCQGCGKRGLRKRLGTDEELQITEANEMVKKTYWYSECVYCGIVNKINFIQE